MDKKKFNLFGLDRLQWCRRGVREEFNAKNVRKEVKYRGGSIMVWGCITSKGYSELHLVERIMDSVQFCKILDDSPWYTEDTGDPKKPCDFPARQ